MLAISDTGIGMDSDTQSRIFEPFFTTKGAKGTGLGLSTVYGIVKQSGGFIFVDSQPQRGTAFRAYFPRVDGREDAAAAQDASAFPAPSVGRRPSSLSKTKPISAVSPASIWKRRATRSSKPKTAPLLCKSSTATRATIDLLLTDVIMPGMNGRELAAQIAKLLPDVRVLYMSGYTENAIGHDGMLDAGINLLQKPFSLPALKDRVREVLDSEPIPLEVAMSSRTGASVLEKEGSAVPSSPFQSPSAAALSSAGRKELAPGHHRKHQPLRIALPGPGIAPSECTAGDQPGAAGGDCRPRRHRSHLSRRSGPLHRSAKAGQGVTPALAAKILQYHFQHGDARRRSVTFVW